MSESVATRKAVERAEALAAPGEPGLVSVVIPTYNRARTLRGAIESVLSQTYASVEVIVVDDGSSDDTRAVAMSYGPRVRYVWQQNGGVSAARNTGFSAARGEFIALLDSDDEFLPWKVAAQVAVMRADPEVGLVWTDMSASDEHGVVRRDRYLRDFYALAGPYAIDDIFAARSTLAELSPDARAEAAAYMVSRGDIFSRMILGNCIHTSTVMLRRERLRLVGGYDESYRVGECYEFHFRIAAYGPVAFIDAPGIRYRIGAADQLTDTTFSVQIARSNVRTVYRWLEGERGRITIAPSLLRRRLADSHAWLGEEELRRGQPLVALPHLWRSLRLHPAEPRRLALLLCCFVPPAAIRGVVALKARRRAAASAAIGGSRASA